MCEVRVVHWCFEVSAEAPIAPSMRLPTQGMLTYRNGVAMGPWYQLTSRHQLSNLEQTKILIPWQLIVRDGELMGSDVCRR